MKKEHNVEEIAKEKSEENKAKDAPEEKKKDMISELAEEVKGIEEKKYFFTFDTTCNV